MYSVKLPDIMIKDEYVMKYKYLGYILTDKWEDDIKIQTRSFFCKSNMLIKEFWHCNENVKKMLYNSFCSNFYCSQLWWSYTKNALNRARIAYNNGFRKLMGYEKFCSASAMYVNNNVNNFDTQRRLATYNFRMRLNTSQNRILIALTHVSIYFNLLSFSN